jgi:hypothetical protein
MPFEFGFLDQDLTAHLPREFKTGVQLQWGLAVGAIPDSWDERITLEGIDWKIILFPPGQFKLPRSVGAEHDKSRTLPVKRHCALLVVVTKQTDPNECREVGRPAARALLGLVRRHLHMLMPNQILWEGIVLPRGKRQTMMSLTETQVTPTRKLDQQHIQVLRMRLLELHVEAMRPQLKRALEWMSLARGARVRTEKFIHLWLATIALIKPGRSADEMDGPRIRAYVTKMKRPQGPLVAAQADALTDILLRAKKARNRFIHRDEVQLITPDILEELERALFVMVDFEILPLSLSDIVV